MAKSCDESLNWVNAFLYLFSLTVSKYFYIAKFVFQACIRLFELLIDAYKVCWYISINRCLFNVNDTVYHSKYSWVRYYLKCILFDTPSFKSHSMLYYYLHHSLT